MTIRLCSILTIAGLLLSACSSDDDSGTEAPDGTGPTNSERPNDSDVSQNDRGTDLDGQSGVEPADCERGRIEPDLMAAPLAGSAVSDGALPSGQYLLSSTYLQLGQDADSQSLFQALITPVAADLQTRPGLLALALGTSASCGSARTLAVWQDEAAMIGFVTGTAHANAMSRVTDVSRGGSLVTHWVGDEGSANWAAAAQRLAADDGPFY